MVYNTLFSSVDLLMVKTKWDHGAPWLPVRLQQFVIYLCTLMITLYSI